MIEFYDFLTGPAAWAAFTICIGGMILRITYLFGLSRERDRVIYNHMDLKWALDSIFHWLVPLGSVALRTQPIFAVAVFVFHACLFAVPICLTAHNILLQESLGISFFSLPENVSDPMTIVLIIASLFLLLRRIIRPEVRILTSGWDYFLLALTTLPFVTGCLAFHQLGPYPLMLVFHVLSAEILLVMIPFSKLGHAVLFFFSRAFIGFEMGQRRGARTW